MISNHNTRYSTLSFIKAGGGGGGVEDLNADIKK